MRRRSPARIGVLVEGKLLQVGTPAELIAAPADPFVASFTGGNLLRGQAATRRRGTDLVRLDDGTELVSADEVYGAVGVIVYPWDVSLSRIADRRLGPQPRHAGGDVDRARSATASASASGRSARS